MGFTCGWEPGTETGRERPGGWSCGGCGVGLEAEGGVAWSGWAEEAGEGGLQGWTTWARSRMRPGLLPFGDSPSSLAVALHQNLLGVQASSSPVCHGYALTLCPKSRTVSALVYPFLMGKGSSKHCSWAQASRLLCPPGLSLQWSFS